MGAWGRSGVRWGGPDTPFAPSPAMWHPPDALLVLAVALLQVDVGGNQGDVPGDVHHGASPAGGGSTVVSGWDPPGAPPKCAAPARDPPAVPGDGGSLRWGRGGSWGGGMMLRDRGCCGLGDAQGWGMLGVTGCLGSGDGWGYMMLGVRGSLGLGDVQGQGMLRVRRCTGMGDAQGYGVLRIR